MESTILKQEDQLENLQKAFRNYKKSPKERITRPFIESKLEHIEKLYTIFFDQHSEIVSKVTVAEKIKLNYFRNEIFDKYDEIYFEFKVKLKEDLEQITSSISKKNSSNQPTNMYEVRLPQINLPTFSGDYDEWQTFYDLFVSLIHENGSLSGVQKLHYLKSSLLGEPANLLKNLSTTEINYVEAWEMLIKRYNNVRYNTNEIMKKLFYQRNVITDSAVNLKQLLDTTTACLKSLNNLGKNIENWDLFINYLVVSKLDQESRKQWEVHVSQTESDALPTWKDLSQFLETRFRTLEMINPSKQLIKQKSFHSTYEKNGAISRTNTCTMCSGSHILYQCKQFANKYPEERSEFVQAKRLCFNCLGHNHAVKFCRQSTCCRRCGKRHHSLLHIERKQESTPCESKELNIATETDTKISTHFTQETRREVLLATAVVKIKAKTGYYQFARALIDQGSEASFINEATVQALGLERTSVNGLITGVGDGKTRTKSSVSFILESRYHSFTMPVEAFVLSTLTSFLPNNTTSITDWPEIENLSLADPQFGEPNRVDIILGVDILSEIILEGLKKHPSKCGLIAQNTQLGWILSGRIHKTYKSNRIINLHLQLEEDQLLTKFWEIERGPENIVKKMTRDEAISEEFFEKTTNRDEEGRYIVRLPFKEEDPQCFKGETKEIALRRFKLLERKLIKNPALYDDYKKVIEDYIIQGHMIKVSDSDTNSTQRVFYLPHHAVIREDKETTKVRCVFDASCKGSNNVSLNSCFIIGPKLQQDLRHILMRWRLHPYCVVADIVQMYRQIREHSDDSDCLRILWRYDPNKPIETYKHVRLTFGTSCAPYLAVKCLQQLAVDEKSKYPIAAKITLQDFYMDDLLTGGDDESEIIDIYDQMNKLMNAGAFCLQKWCTNSENLLNHIKADKIGSNQAVIFKENNMIKVLGICWNKNTDNFEYLHHLPEADMPITKRKVLSDIARLYDPLGWIAPVIITAKIYMQKLWKSGLAWDDNLTPDLLKEWLAFRRDLVNVQGIIIPRWLQVKRGYYVELHAFADASQAAYAAAVYMKSKDEIGNVRVHLITARTRVAPVEKEISIPRLELCAALLAAQLIFEVSQVLNIPKERLRAWSDSTIVLAWITGEPSRWTTFVSNRVSEILTILNRDQWNHVNSKENPADYASRGIQAEDLKDLNLWWFGPLWLKEINEYKTYKPSDFITNEEQRSIKNMSAVVQIKEEEFLWTKFSNLQRLMRVLSYCRRVLLWKIPNKMRLLSENITPEERNTVLQICIKDTQHFHFKNDINKLKSDGYVSKSSKLHTLCPILDVDGILRVGGRIEHSQASFDTKHSIILPSTSHLTKLIIQDAHLKTLHGGPLAMLNYLRSKFWILRARDNVKKCYRNCITCLRYARQKTHPFMGQLPSVRLKPERAFKSTGVDFTGFIKLRFAPGRGSKSYKGYICVFICMITRAVHLEAVSNLSTEGFIAAFRRFVSRRGYCKDLYSDNGTNFVGADKELREMFNKATSEFSKEIKTLLANEGTTWHYIPPQAPNFGGLWEACVRSTKYHLKRVIGDTTLTYEELATVLTQIEACLNSRPLCQLSDNSDDVLPLTPGHFLIGEPLITIPDEDYSKSNITGLQRWKLLQKMLNDFWKRWSAEYLITLNQRFKWSSKGAEPEIGDIVIIRDENLPPAKWLLGKIEEKHSGKDNITRVVTVKTKNGLLKRACNKLCFLPMTESVNDN